MRIENINLTNAVLQQEYRLGVLEKVVDLLVQRFPRIGGVISESEMMDIRQSVVSQLRQKYPDAGIQLER